MAHKWIEHWKRAWSATGYCARKTEFFARQGPVRRRHRHDYQLDDCPCAIHGGLAQGIGPALSESETYKVDSGQILARSFLDYDIPRTDDLIDFAGEPDESQPCTNIPLGTKGCGESGSIGAPAALVSAVLDALDPLGVDDIGRPLIPLCVWSAIPEAKSR